MEMQQKRRKIVSVLLLFCYHCKKKKRRFRVSSGICLLLRFVFDHARGLCLDLLKIGKAGKTVLQRNLRIALDQREQIVDILLAETVAASVDPLTRDLAFRIGAGFEVYELDLALVIALFVRLAAEADHLIGNAVDCVFDRDAARLKGLRNIGLRGRMRGAALQEREFYAADLRVLKMLSQNAYEGGCKTAELLVTEAVDHSVLRTVFGDQLAALVVNAFGNGNKDFSVIFIDLTDVIDELVDVKVGLGKIDEIGTESGIGRRRGARRKPTCVTAHDLNDADHRLVVDARVKIQLHARADDIARRGREAGAVIGAIEVVVDRLRNAHDTALITNLLHILADLVAGVHGIVAADIEEIPDIVFLEYLKDLDVIGIVFLIILELVTAGAERGRRRVQKQRKLISCFFAHIVKDFVDDAADAVRRAVDFIDMRVVQSRTDDAVDACVDHGSRSAGLSDDAIADQFVLHKCLQIKMPVYYSESFQEMQEKIRMLCKDCVRKHRRIGSDGVI